MVGLDFLDSFGTLDSQRIYGNRIVKLSNSKHNLRDLLDKVASFLTVHPHHST